MADSRAESLILYTLKQGGDLDAKLPATARKLRDVGDAAGKAKSELGDLGEVGKRAAEKLGGPLSDVYETVTEILPQLAQLGGGLGLVAAAAAGTAIAAGALLAVTKGLADAAVESAQRLEDLGIAVGPEAANKLRDYTKASYELGVQWDELKVLIGSELAPMLAKLAEVVALVIKAYRDAYDATEDLRGALDVLARVMQGVVTLGWSEVARLALDQATAGHAAAEATNKWADALERLARASEEAALKNAELIAQQDIAEGARQQALADERARKYQAYLQRVAAAANQPISGVAGTTQGLPPNALRGQPLPGTTASYGVGSLNSGFTYDASTKAVAEGVKRGLAEAQVAGGITGGVGALNGGMTGLLAAGGPWGAAIAAVYELLPHIDETIANIHKEAMDWPSDVRKAIRNLLADLPDYIRDGVSHVAEDSALIPELIGSLIEAAPQIFAAVIEAALMGPALIIEALSEAIGNVWDAIKHLPRELAQALGGVARKAGDLAGIHLGKEAGARGEREFLGVHIPRFDRFAMHGGRITEGGLARVHKGEPIGGRGGGNTVSISIGQVVAPNAERFVEQLQTLLGTRGINLSLTPNGG